MTLDPATYTPDRPFTVPDAWTRADRDLWLERSVTIGVEWLGRTVAIPHAAACRAPGSATSPGASYDPRAGAQWALSLAQSKGYVPDPDDGRVEQFQPVAWTWTHGGDCEDLAALLRALAGYVGVLSRFALQPYEGQPIDHETAQVFVAHQWIWADASIPGARLGEEPGAAAARLPKPTGFLLPGPWDDAAILAWLRKPRRR